MNPSPRLEREFFNRPVQLIARELLGKRLVRMLDGERLSGVIIETEAYDGEEDLACHARAGRTKRTAVMYEPPGHAYLYFNYGMHWMLNFVTGEEGYPAAVLIRGIQPLESLESMRERRGKQPFAQWCNGPGKICSALDIDGNSNGMDICADSSLIWVENAVVLPDERVLIGPRVGIPNVPEPWRSVAWRYRVV